MLCWQDCIDMCDLAPDEECVVRDCLTVAELGAAVMAHERLYGHEPVCGVVCRHFRLAHVPEVLKEGDIFTYRLAPPTLPHFGHARRS